MKIEISGIFQVKHAAEFLMPGQNPLRFEVCEEWPGERTPKAWENVVMWAGL